MYSGVYFFEVYTTVETKPGGLFILMYEVVCCLKMITQLYTANKLVDTVFIVI